MRVIPTRTHGIIDYATGSALLAAPELFRLKDSPSSALVPRILGAGATAASLMTNYELGAVKVIPMPVHLAVDAGSGAFLASSPWLLGYAKNGPRYWIPHVLVGASEVAVSLLTKKAPPVRKRKGILGKLLSLRAR